MRPTSTTVTVLRNLSIAIVVAFAAGSAALAQITVTNATFPVAGDTLKTAVASNPAIGVSVYTPPGGPQTWDLSGLQPGTIKSKIFKPASQGTVGAQVPGAELFTVNAPGTEDYYNVTSNRFELQAYYGIAPYDIVANNLFVYTPPLAEREAPLNFFDIYQSSSSAIKAFLPSAFPPSLIAALGGGIDSLRYRTSVQRLEVVDAFGSLIIPGGTYNVLREKRTQYRNTRLDGHTFLGWLDFTDVAVNAGFHGLSVDTVVTYFFYNDVAKEPIAEVTFNNEINATTQVIYKYKAPVVLPSLSINDVTQSEGNTGSSNFNFTVSLSSPAPAGGVTFNIATADNTATTANGDYVAKSLTSQTIPAGSSTYNFSVGVNGDIAVEPNETFFVNVTSVTGATILDGQGLGTITNDDNGCTPPVVTAPKVTQPSCLLPTGTIAVKATAATTMQYSIDNGATFLNTATFKNLAVGSYNIVVRLSATPDCKAAYTSNPVIINPVAALVAPTVIMGPVGVCRNSTGQVFSVAPVAGATSYQWTLPTGATGSSTKDSISLSFNGSYTSGNICVKAINACGQSPSFCQLIKYYDTKPSTPGAITGKTIGLCSNQIYSVAAVPNTTTYNWVIPANTTLRSGQGTTQIELAFLSGFVSGPLSVTASNCNGTSAAQSVQLARNPDMPASISGPVSAVCAGSTQNYSCALSPGATVYTWKVPTTAVINSGQGTNAISVTFASTFITGSISVTAGTTCATKSAAKSITITSKPAVPAAIAGPASVCSLATALKYSTTAVPGVTYNWTVPNGATITAGQGTAAITVNMGTLAGSVKVSGGNLCGSSAFQSLAVSVIACKPAAFTTAGSEGTQSAALPQVRVWPNPATSALNVQLTGYAGNVTLQLSDLEGKILRQQKLQAGGAKTAQQKINVAGLANGIYLLTAIDEKGNIETEKVIISR